VARRLSKWICGFANAQSGKIYIGKDDVGIVVGVEDYKCLMDEIPNKIKNLMGITAEVNLLQKTDKHFIEINYSDTRQATSLYTA
jgi:ATP-dependent DNA helicase RecG